MICDLFDKKFDEKFVPIQMELREMRKDIEGIEDSIKDLRSETYNLTKFVISLGNYLEREIDDVRWRKTN